MISDKGERVKVERSKVELGAVKAMTPEWFEYYDDSPKDGYLNVEEFMRFYRQRKRWQASPYLGGRSEISSVELVDNRLNDPPVGHLQKLGSHRPPKANGIREVDYALNPEDPAPLTPRDFWQNHVIPHVPVILRNVEKNSRAYKYWGDSSGPNGNYFMKNFGDVGLKLEPRKEDRGNNKAYEDMESFLREKSTKSSSSDDSDNNDSSIEEGEDDRDEAANHRTQISDFLTRGKGREAFAVSILPQKMAWDCGIPSALLCGSRRSNRDKEGTSRLIPHPFPHPKQHLLENVDSSESKNKENVDYLTHLFEANLWLAHGPTHSQLHYDKENIVMCLYQGAKDFVMIDTRKFFDKIGHAWVRGRRYRGENDLLNAGTDWVDVDVLKVDMKVNWFLQDVEYDGFRLNAGDCVYMPYSYLHQVSTNWKGPNTSNNGTSEELQIATSYMFLPESYYDEEVCDAKVMPILESEAVKKEWKGIVRNESSSVSSTVSLTQNSNTSSTSSTNSSTASASAQSNIINLNLKTPRPLHFPAAAYDILWYYSGKGVIPQGYPDPESIRELLETELKNVLHHKFTIRKNQKKKKKSKKSKKTKEFQLDFFELSEKDILKAMWVQTVEENPGSRMNEHSVSGNWRDAHKNTLLRQYAKEFKESIVKFYKNNPSSNESNIPKLTSLSQAISLELWLRYSVEADSEGGLPCDKGHDYDPRTSEEWQRMNNAVIDGYGRWADVNNTIRLAGNSDSECSSSTSIDSEGRTVTNSARRCSKEDSEIVE